MILEGQLKEVSYNKAHLYTYIEMNLATGDVHIT